MKKLLIVVDMQHDFVDGALGSPDAQAIVPNVKARIEAYRQNGDTIIFTKDTHFENYMETSEGKHLPVPHCISGTEGWMILDELYHEGEKIVLKPTFGSIALMTLPDVKEADEIEIVGLCTDICVMSNAILLKAAYPEKRIAVNKDCTAATSLLAYKSSMVVFESCQIEIVGG